MMAIITFIRIRAASHATKGKENTKTMRVLRVEGGANQRKKKIIKAQTIITI